MKLTHVTVVVKHQQGAGVLHADYGLRKAGRLHATGSPAVPHRGPQGAGHRDGPLARRRGTGAHARGLTQPGVSRHLKVLREANLVDVTVHAQERIYSLNPEGMADLYAWVAKYQAMWPEALDSLERYLDAGAVRDKAKGRRP